mmetsp:Transcript_61551/g.156373  ORF Transcript_61551/g.156373 Transcript_61551/m.156373 type:complete len:214 (+) Transcript_61551:385-1026(+)
MRKSQTKPMPCSGTSSKLNLELELSPRLEREGRWAASTARRRPAKVSSLSFWNLPWLADSWPHFRNSVDSSEYDLSISAHSGPKLEPVSKCGRKSTSCELLLCLFGICAGVVCSDVLKEVSEHCALKRSGLFSPPGPARLAGALEAEAERVAALEKGAAVDQLAADNAFAGSTSAKAEEATAGVAGRTAAASRNCSRGVHALMSCTCVASSLR